MTTRQADIDGREEWLSVRAACALVGVSPATLRRWSNAGVIATFTTPGGHRRFARSAVLDLLSRDPEGVPPDGDRTGADGTGGDRTDGDRRPLCIGLLARRIGHELAAAADGAPAERAAALARACDTSARLGRAAGRQRLWARVAVQAVLDAAPPPGAGAPSGPGSGGPGTTDLLIRAALAGYDEASAEAPDAGTCAAAAPAPPADALAPSVVALVAHARDVPSEEREAFADRIEAQGVGEGMILVRTCHRTELYATPAALAERPAPDPPAGTRRLADADAARHLIALACGLESAILGEDQVLGQLRDALAVRRAAGALDPVLGRLFQVALHAGRRAHAWFRGMHRSLGEVAVERALGARAVDGGGTLLVVGAGSMGRLTALAAARRGIRVVIANRTPMRAATLARDVDGTTAPFPGDRALASVDGIVVAVSGPWEVDAEAAGRIRESGIGVVDLSSPPAVPAGLRDALGARHTSIDDLSWNQGVELPPSLVSRLERLVSESGGEFCSWLRTRDAVPALQAMARAAEERRREELDWLARRLPALGEEERATVAQMTNRLVAGLLHGPRAALASDPSGELGRAALELFGA